jgi:hypothetical protein
MPVSVESALLASISPELKARMQGKSCFNLRDSDQVLFTELAELTRGSFNSYRAQGFV